MDGEIRKVPVDEKLKPVLKSDSSLSSCDSSVSRLRESGRTLEWGGENSTAR